MSRALCFLAYVVMLAAPLACDRGRDGDCSNRACTCKAGHDCELSCEAPPCDVSCEQGARCDAVCANGSCRCGPDARCDFACKAPPCHVECAGDNPQCDGTCANGTCACGTNSSCFFRCESGPCHTTCPQGASCVVLCPNAPAGTQDCDILECWAGAPTLCPGLGATVCNASCPGDGDAGR
ncbi:MAG TPA: hypothetical protein VFZ61_13435 [Polyangiales bacterium]